MHLAFLTPLAAVAIVLVFVPLAAAAAARSRAARMGRLLGLPRARVAGPLAVSIAIAVTLALVGIAAAQPVIQHGARQRARTNAEAYVVLDISRSMGAAPGPHSVDRLSRAKRFAIALRARVPSVPVGVAAFTDRVLPLEFPGVDPSSFASVVREAVGIDEPGPQRFYSDRATTFDTLAQFAQEAYFDPGVAHRAIVVLTDGESQPVSPTLGDELRRPPGVHVVFVDVARPGDKVWIGGAADPNYHADPTSDAFLRRVASSLHGTSVSGNDVGAAAKALRGAIGTGPVRTLTEPSRLALMPYVTLAALVPLAFVLWRRNVRR